MKTLTTYSNNLLNLKKLYFLFIALFILALPDFALAAGIPELATGNIGIPGVDKDTPIMKTLGQTIGFVVFILVIAILGFGLGDTIASFFRQLNDSRKEGDWSPLIRFIGLAFAILAIIFVIMGYINAYVFTPANNL